MIGLNEILERRVDEILKDSTLLIPMLKYYSILYLCGGTPRTCASSHRQYYIKLKQDGLERLNKLAMAKYQLKPGVVITFSGQTYNSGTITDEIASEYLTKFPKASFNFNIREDKPEVKAPVAQEKLPEQQEKAPEVKAPQVQANKRHSRKRKR